MSDLPIWAQDRAREWIIRANFDGKSIDPVWLDTTTAGVKCLTSLAALLREVGQREWDLGHGSAINAMLGHKPDCSGVDPRENRCECGWLESRAGTEITTRRETLAEVRRVVEDVQKSIWGAPTDEGSAVTLCCSEILARLDKLDTPRLSTESEAKAAMGQGQPLTKMRELL